MSPQAVSGVEAGIRELTVTLIEGFKAAGGCNFTKDFAEQLPIRIFMRIVDLPDEHIHQLKYLADQFTRPDGSLEFADVRRLFQAYIAPVVAARRGGTGTDMLSRMINGQVHGRALTDEEAANLCIQVLVGGLDTVVNFMGFVMLFLAQNPDARAELAAHTPSSATTADHAGIPVTSGTVRHAGRSAAWAYAIDADVLMLLLLGVIAREVWVVLQARRRGRAAARLHIQVVALFSFIAAAPAILVTDAGGYKLVP